jgi:tetratricopeptide (TPR) repeat protein
MAAEGADDVPVAELLARGLAAHRAGALGDAARLYVAALSRAPRDAQALRLAGLLAAQAGDAARGAALLEAARAATGDVVEAELALGDALRALGRAAEALAAVDAALALAPGNAPFHANRANALRDLGRLAEARDACDRAVALEPGLADARRNRAMLMLLAGDWEAGWREWEWRKRSSEPSGDRFPGRPAWTGAGDLAGRRVFLHWEQGFGDTIQFCRYAPLLAARGAQVTLAVQEPLLRLARSLGPEVEVAGGAREPAGGFDLHCALMSLPLAFGTTPGSVPPPAPLRAPPELEAAWAARLGPRDGRPRIGLAWSGRPSHANDSNRSMPFAVLAPLLDAGMRWISVQQEIRPADEAALRADGRVEHFGAEIGDFADTAALLGQLDLVLSVDTAVAHLAGTLGLPLWLLLPRDPDWRWLAGREDSPWYPSARLFRQAVPGDWAGVAGRVSAALAEWRRRAAPPAQRPCGLSG